MLAQLLPDPLLEVAADRRQRQVEVLEVAGEVRAQLARGLDEHRVGVVAVAARPAVAVAERRELDLRSSRRRARRAAARRRGVDHGPHVSSPCCAVGATWVDSGHQGVPEVHQGVGAPGPPAVAVGDRPRPGRGRGRPARCGRRGRSAGRRRGGRARASRRSRRSTARCRAAPRSARAYVVAVGAAVEGHRRRRRAPRRARPAPGRGPAASAAPRGRARRASAASGNRWVSPGTSVATGVPCAATSRPATVRAPATLDLLAEHRADRGLVAVDLAGHPEAAGRPDQRADDRVAGELVVDGDRVAVGVDQPAGPLDGGGGVAQVVQPNAARDERRLARSTARRRARAGRCRGRAGRSRVRAYQPWPATSTPGTRWWARKSSSGPAGERRADGEPHRHRRPCVGARRGGRAARSGWRRRPRGRCR